MKQSEFPGDVNDRRSFIKLLAGGSSVCLYRSAQLCRYRGCQGNRLR